MWATADVWGLQTRRGLIWILHHFYCHFQTKAPMPRVLTLLATYLCMGSVSCISVVIWYQSTSSSTNSLWLWLSWIFMKTGLGMIVLCSLKRLKNKRQWMSAVCQLSEVCIWTWWFFPWTSISQVLSLECNDNKKVRKHKPSLSFLFLIN